ncbi:MAG: thiamine pyrophosphate-dependent enzyme [Vampirovibrionales bacterium]|nr:thiamine pyrophosphate-dependent enzyme [Vampirovibrionales bacterium]
MVSSAPVFKSSQIKSDVHPDWCAGCGDFGITNALQASVAELGLNPWEVYFFTGVGCSGKTSHYLNVYGAHTLHGRVLAFAAGAKLSNPKLTVIAAGGDGDGYGIGAGHFVHAGRRNLDMTYVVFNNEVYGLTKGQASPTLAKGAQPKSLAVPNPQHGINPLAMALACGYTFIARTYAFDQKHMKETIKKAIEHPGMALVDVLQPCPTYNDLHTKDYFSETVEAEGKTLPRIAYLEDLGYDGVVQDANNQGEVTQKRAQCFERVNRMDVQTPIGVFYQIHLPTYYDAMRENLPGLKDTTPVNLPYHDANLIPTTDLGSAIEEFLV